MFFSQPLDSAQACQYHTRNVLELLSTSRIVIQTAIKCRCNIFECLVALPPFASLDQHYAKSQKELVC